MKDQDARGWYVYRTLKRTADRTQAPIRGMLEAQGISYESFWVANVIIAHGRPCCSSNTLAARPDVKVIESNNAVELADATGRSLELGLDDDHDVSPDDDRAGRHPGQGTRTCGPSASTGTGIVDRQPGHGHALDAQRAQAALPGLERRVRRPQLQLVRRDPLRRRRSCAPNHQEPCDDNAHGTHTTGTTSVTTAAGNQIGVAPGAKWIGCRNMDQGERNAGDLHRVLPVLHRADGPQAAEPEPDAAAARDEQQLGLPAERRLRAGHAADDRREHEAAGIFVEVSAGNAGPDCSTVNDSASRSTRRRTRPAP